MITVPDRPRRTRRRTRADRGDRGDAVAFTVLWPTMIVAVLLLGVHTFIVVNAQAEASLAASAGLRAAWRTAADSDLAGARNDAARRVDEAALMGEGAADAVARVAGAEDGWRWWTGGSSATYSDWCATSQSDAPAHGEPGWVRVVVSGDVLGPLSWLLPGRMDKVYAVAEGPALLSASPSARLTGLAGETAVPAEWSQADLARC